MVKLRNIKIIFLLILAFIVALGGTFWWWQPREIKGSPDDYVIKDTAEGKIVENKKAGLVVKVPEGWEAEKINEKEGFLILYPARTTTEWQDEKISLPLKSGCFIDVSIVYEKMDFADIKLDIKYILSGLTVKSQEFEEIMVNNHQALKNIFDTEKIGAGIGVNIPLDNKEYVFYLYWGSDEKENCTQEFNKFLETVSIK